MGSTSCLRELDELIELFIGHVQLAACGWNQRRVQAKPPFGPGRLGLIHGPFDAGQNQLARGATLARGCLVQPAVQIPRKVDGRADGGLLHASLCSKRLK